MNILTLLVLLMAFISPFTLQPSPSPEVTVTYSEAGNIYVTNFQDEPTRLTDGVSYNILPTWSSDGQQLAFLSDVSTSPTGQYHVAVMNVRTREVKQVSSLELTSEANLSWSPDSKHIAVTLGALFVVDLETGQTRELSVDNINAQSPSWSADSTRIAFSAAGGVYVIYADGHDIQKIGTASIYNYQPQWSSAANRILFTSNQGNAVGMNTVDGESYTATQLLEPQSNTIQNLQWSGDGKQVAFTVSGANDPKLAVTDSADVYVLNADGTNLHAVSNKGVDLLIGWTTDNKHVLYQSGEPGGAAVSIIITNVEDGKTIILSDDSLLQMCAYGNCQNITIRP